MRKLTSYIARYGPEAGPRLYHALQSQAAHAGVSARLRRKIETLTGRPFGRQRTAARLAETTAECLPLFARPAGSGSGRSSDVLERRPSCLPVSGEDGPDDLAVD